MKITLNLEWLIIIILAIAGIYLFVLYREADKGKVDAETTVKEMALHQIQEKETQRKFYKKDSTAHVEKIDSAKRVYNALEVKRKSDNYYYQNKLNALHTINNFSKRQHYADSLSGTIR